MSSEHIRIWRDSKHVMGALLGPNLAEGEAEFQEMDEPYGRFQQCIAGIVAARRLQERLGIGGVLPIIWSTADTEKPHPLENRESRLGFEEESDPADWWKNC